MTAMTARCELCGEPMPAGEAMFKYHGYSGPCPKPPKQAAKPNSDVIEALTQALEYFEDREDVVDGIYGEPSPNREMSLAQMCRDALALAGG